jgi:hypothetical protein
MWLAFLAFLNSVPHDSISSVKQLMGKMGAIRCKCAWTDGMERLCRLTKLTSFYLTERFYALSEQDTPTLGT